MGAMKNSWFKNIGLASLIGSIGPILSPLALAQTAEESQQIETLTKLGQGFDPFGLPVVSLPELALRAVTILLGAAAYTFLIGMVASMTLYLFSAGNEDQATKAKKNIVYVLVGLVITFGGYAALNWLIFTRGVGASIASGSLGRLIGTAVNATLAVSSIGFMLLLLYGGVRLVFQAGNEEGTTAAKRQMTTAFAGLILVLAAYAISKFLLQRFGVLAS
jgi:hypothetical protein